MPSAQDCADRLREQAYRTLLPQIRDLEEELQKVGSSLSAGINQIERKLEALRHIELPTTEVVLGEILGETIRQKDLEASALVLFTHGLRQKETQEEILTFLLDNAQKYFPRVALFAVRGDQFIGWSSRGYPESPARDISSCAFARSESPQFERVIESEGPAVVPDLSDNDFLKSLQKDDPGQWHLFPLQVMHRPVALLLGREAEGVSCRPDVISILMDFTALRLENIALRILYELTAARPSAPQPAPAETAGLEGEPEPAPAIRYAQAAAAQMPVTEPVFSVPDFGPQPSPTEEPPAPAPPAETFYAEAPVEEAAIPVAEPAEAPIPAAEIEAAKAWPQEIRPIPEEEKLHTEAKRFARLLVTEIKLYNEHHVVEGRANRDLYLRLKRDIDRSREMYEKRVSPSVAQKIDYFHDEIIRILGDNDPSTLGSDYPGPRVES